ncbi:MULTISPECIES: cell division protein ZipA C-terminal FtsZ-binding domain-containing protein [Neisseria]|uniref:Cell division protein ZipA n=1 Tax=Neisseria dumasiana TaxID=1931275 RepID=A0ABX3WQC1_9NEIS|nr:MULTISPECIES: cell division protein ZipA C-terminal FtsZ-binding domain-containing protein [Neisseria]KPN74850.1 cell division protein ZipA [Neisseria sp. 74A18]OSI15633.1 cell division protein ZipA [Neisseria dumasiana]OSI36660.1 cell division protein ZipA [Neisseria dumasiana]UOO85264.1 cell division protein ZipA [Neisseria dumasiana]
MSETILIIVVLGLAIILAIIAYNMYQENQYRQQVRRQFGHSDKDALMGSKTDFVRDGKSQDQTGVPLRPIRQKDISTPAFEPKDDLFAAKVSQAAANKPDVEIEYEDDFKESVIEPETKEADAAYDFKRVAAPVYSQTKLHGKRKLLLDLHDLPKLELPWFDPRFDYMAYISLSEPQELHTIPRLSSRHRFQIAGCTMDDRFQIAEPIPSVYYQGFIIGLQSISRSGLATTQELEHFGEQVNQFAEKMNGGLLLTDVETFLNVARPLDELCARVDQTIAMHLVSRGTVSGVELRSAVEQLGFELGVDGAFHFPDEKGEPLFTIVTLDNSPFTSSLLDSQAYRGFSMLFDIPHVPAGEKQFNRFMDLAVKLSSNLGLDLVNDKLEELSTQWLKDVRTYVLARQDEMKKVGIEPAGELSKRLFS